MVALADLLVIQEWTIDLGVGLRSLVALLVSMFLLLVKVTASSDRTEWFIFSLMLLKQSR